jgi:hypothetical protein
VALLRQIRERDIAIERHFTGNVILVDGVQARRIELIAAISADVSLDAVLGLPLTQGRTHI